MITTAAACVFRGVPKRKYRLVLCGTVLRGEKKSDEKIIRTYGQQLRTASITSNTILYFLNPNNKTVMDRLRSCFFFSNVSFILVGIYTRAESAYVTNVSTVIVLLHVLAADVVDANIIDVVCPLQNLQTSV